MKITARAGVAGLLTSVALVGVATAADVNVRVEGASTTLVPKTLVTPSTSVKVTKSAATCAGTSGGGALELATSGDWGGSASDFGSGPDQSVETIKGEAYPFSQVQKYWALYVNNAPSPVGICDFTPQQGDEILLYPACIKATTGCFTDGSDGSNAGPLDLSAPATVRPGVPFDVNAVEYTSPFGATPTKVASSGATITGGDAAVTTNAAGVAAVTTTTRGPLTLTVTKGPRVRDEVTVCSSDGADGYCGYTIPTPTPTAGPGATPTPTATATATPDTTKPATAISLKARYKKGKGPRTLTATVSDAGGLSDVSLALTGKFGKVCKGFGNTKGRFRKLGCKRRLGFSVGSSPTVSFLLPKKLTKGSYTFLVVATDKAGNRSDTVKTFVVK